MLTRPRWPIGWLPRLLGRVPASEMLGGDKGYDQQCHPPEDREQKGCSPSDNLG
jgi:hypothetical protein